MKVFQKRPIDMGKLVVVGGPGGSGASTIARMLAKKYSLHYVYGGLLMRQFAKDAGFENVEEFLEKNSNSDEQFKYDKIIDEKLLRMSYQPDVLIDSKVFAGLTTKRRIPCTVKIWVTCDLDTRIRRTLHKEGKVDLKVELSTEDALYKDTMGRLVKRQENDRGRYTKLYGIDFDRPDMYNDIVFDSSKFDVHRTFSLLVKRIEEGGYFR